MMPVVGDEPCVGRLARRRYFGVGPTDAGHRALGSTLFTDIVASTEAAARMGDAAWHELLGAYNSATRRERYRGREIDTTGDGILALFDGATRSSDATLVTGARSVGLEIRVGIHTGEYEQVGSSIRGLAVHVAARVMASAEPNEVRVSAATAALLDPRRSTSVPWVRDGEGVPAPVELFTADPA